MFSTMHRFVVWAKAVGAAAVVVIAGANAQAQTLECAAVSSGGGITSNGSILVVGQAVVGTMSNASFTIEAGIIPCLVPGVCVTTADCDDENDCTIDTCDPGNPEAGSDGCVNDPVQRLFGDVMAPFCPPDCPQPGLEDIMCLLEDFGDGPPVSGCAGSLYSTDLAPCGGDGILDLDDVLNVLDAFAQVFQCSDPCP